MHYIQRKITLLWADVRKGKISSGFEGLGGTVFCSLMTLGQLELHMADIL